MAPSALNPERRSYKWPNSIPALKRRLMIKAPLRGAFFAMGDGRPASRMRLRASFPGAIIVDRSNARQRLGEASQKIGRRFSAGSFGIIDSSVPTPTALR